jgi:hypothetical protein
MSVLDAKGAIRVDLWARFRAPFAPDQGVRGGYAAMVRRVGLLCA